MTTPNTPTALLPSERDETEKLEDRAIALMREMFQTELSRMEQLSKMVEDTRTALEAGLKAATTRLTEAADLMEEALDRVDSHMQEMAEATDGLELAAQLTEKAARTVRESQPPATPEAATK